MPGDLGGLAVCAGAGPKAYVLVNSLPDEAGSDEALRDTNARVREIMKLTEGLVAMALRQVRTDSSSRDVSIESDLCAWKSDLLHLECWVVQEFLQFGVAGLVSSNSSVVKGGGHSSNTARKCVCRSVVSSFYIANVCGVLRNVI